MNRKGKEEFYCQICKKQCGDLHGYKVHIESDTHRRNAKNNKINYDALFRAGMIQIIKYRAKNFIDANTIYNEYISKMDHVRINSTSYKSLSSFIASLVAQGIVEGELNENSWIIKITPDLPSQDESDQIEKIYLSDINLEVNRPKLSLKSVSSPRKKFELKNAKNKLK